MNGTPWSDAEDALVLDLSRSPVELSRDLGRTVASIGSRRSRLLRSHRAPGRDAHGAMRIPKGKASWLLAKTCPMCGELLPADAFGTRKPSAHTNAYCKPCHSRRVTERRHDDSAYRTHFDGLGHARQRTIQAEAKDRARNNRKQWTGAELELVMRDDLTDKQKAEMLGRTFYAVRHIIQKMRSGDPMKTRVAGLPQP